jgi:hypothetical protein
VGSVVRARATGRVTQRAAATADDAIMPIYALPPPALPPLVLEQPAPALAHGSAMAADVHRSVDHFVRGGGAPVVTLASARREVAFAPTAEYRREKAWAEAHGVDIPAGRVTVVAKRRGDDARTTRYEDDLVVFKRDGTVEHFAGSTKPAQPPREGSRLVPDVDRDGRKDLGMVRPGEYTAVGPHVFGLPGDKRPAFKVLSGGRDSVPAWRDLDGDGRFSSQEKDTSEARGYRLGMVRIHYGFDARGTTVGDQRYSGAWSVGCQNVPYGDLERFVAAVGGRSATFKYAVVEDR